MGSAAFHTAFQGQNALRQFYIGATLAGSGSFYNKGRTEEAQREVFGYSNQHLAPVRLPFYYSLLAPPARLPYRLALSLWNVATILAAVLFVSVIDYPWLKLRLNRMANLFTRLLFVISLNDTTNAFKAYRRTVIEGCQPLLSAHFNLTVEIPLKVIICGYSWTVLPITWRNRRTGMAKLKIQEMGSRYLFLCLYLWLENHLSRGDYKKESE